MTPEHTVKLLSGVIVHGASMFTLPVAVAEPQVDWQVMVYSQWSPTIWIFDITGAVSQLQVTFPRAMIWDMVGVTLEQTVKGTDVIVHELPKHT